MTRHVNRWGRIAAVLAFSVGAGACDDLLEVDLPAQLGDEALDNPAGAESVVITFIEHFEQAVDLMVWQFHGHEDGGEIYLASPGTNAGDMTYGTDASGGPRSGVQLGTGSGYEGWFSELATTVRFSKFLHEKLTDEWTDQQVANRARFMALASLYEGAALARMGESLCEVALAGGPLMAPDEVLDMAETTLTRALAEIAALPGGDIAVPYDIATSAQAMAYGLRAQAKWMNGDLAGAAADAAMVPSGFTAYVTRDANSARNNKAHFAGTLNRYAELYDVNDWWQAANRTNPVTGQPWPAVIPFTGYVALGILPDGRAVRDDGLPIRRPGAFRTEVPGIEASAVEDTRVPFFLGQVAGAGGATQQAIHRKYATADSDIPLVNWKELALIRAEAAGGQTAIDLVNEIRAADGLPLVTYITGATATPQQIRYMIIEERRRSLFLEGRFLMTKIKNTDLLWFPRAQGQTPGAGRALGGGVRFHMPNNEFLYNPNLNGDLNLRGTLCAQAERPVIPV